MVFSEISILKFTPEFSLNPPQPYFSSLPIISSEFRPHWTLVCLVWSEVQEFTLLDLLSHCLGSCFFQWNLTHPSWPWLNLFPLQSPSLHSVKIHSFSFFNNFLHLCWGTYYSLSQCLVLLKYGVPCDSLFHSQNSMKDPTISLHM